MTIDISRIKSAYINHVANLLSKSKQDDSAHSRILRNLSKDPSSKEYKQELESLSDFINSSGRQKFAEKRSGQKSKNRNDGKVFEKVSAEEIVKVVKSFQEELRPFKDAQVKEERKGRANINQEQVTEFNAIRTEGKKVGIGKKLHEEQIKERRKGDSAPRVIDLVTQNIITSSAFKTIQYSGSAVGAFQALVGITSSLSNVAQIIRNNIPQNLKDNIAYYIPDAVKSAYNNMPAMPRAKAAGAKAINYGLPAASLGLGVMTSNPYLFGIAVVQVAAGLTQNYTSGKFDEKALIAINDKICEKLGIKDIATQEALAANISAATKLIITAITQYGSNKLIDVLQEGGKEWAKVESKEVETAIYDPKNPQEFARSITAKLNSIKEVAKEDDKLSKKFLRIFHPDIFKEGKDVKESIKEVVEFINRLKAKDEKIFIVTSREEQKISEDVIFSPIIDPVKSPASNQAFSKKSEYNFKPESLKTSNQTNINQEPTAIDNILKFADQSANFMINNIIFGPFGMVVSNANTVSAGRTMTYTNDQSEDNKKREMEPQGESLLVAGDASPSSLVGLEIPGTNKIATIYTQANGKIMKVVFDKDTKTSSTPVEIMSIGGATSTPRIASAINQNGDIVIVGMDNLGTSLNTKIVKADGTIINGPSVSSETSLANPMAAFSSTGKLMIGYSKAGTTNKIRVIAANNVNALSASSAFSDQGSITLGSPLGFVNLVNTGPDNFFITAFTSTQVRAVAINNGVSSARSSITATPQGFLKTLKTNNSGQTLSYYYTSSNQINLRLYTEDFAASTAGASGVAIASSKLPSVSILSDGRIAVTYLKTDNLIYNQIYSIANPQSTSAALQVSVAEQKIGEFNKAGYSEVSTSPDGNGGYYITAIESASTKDVFTAHIGSDGKVLSPGVNSVQDSLGTQVILGQIGKLSFYKGGTNNPNNIFVAYPDETRTPTITQTKGHLGGVAKKKTETSTKSPSQSLTITPSESGTLTATITETISNKFSMEWSFSGSVTENKSGTSTFTVSPDISPRWTLVNNKTGERTVSPSLSESQSSDVTNSRSPSITNSRSSGTTSRSPSITNSRSPSLSSFSFTNSKGELSLTQESSKSISQMTRSTFSQTLTATFTPSGSVMVTLPLSPTRTVSYSFTPPSGSLTESVVSDTTTGTVTRIPTPTPSPTLTLAKTNSVSSSKSRSVSLSPSETASILNYSKSFSASVSETLTKTLSESMSVTVSTKGDATLNQTLENGDTVTYEGTLSGSKTFTATGSATVTSKDTKKSSYSLTPTTSFSVSVSPSKTKTGSFTVNDPLKVAAITSETLTKTISITSTLSSTGSVVPGSYNITVSYSPTLTANYTATISPTNSGSLTLSPTMNLTDTSTITPTTTTFKTPAPLLSLTPSFTTTPSLSLSNSTLLQVLDDTHTLTQSPTITKTTTGFTSTVTISPTQNITTEFKHTPVADNPDLHTSVSVTVSTKTASETKSTTITDVTPSISVSFSKSQSNSDSISKEDRTKIFTHSNATHEIYNRTTPFETPTPIQTQTQTPTPTKSRRGLSPDDLAHVIARFNLNKNCTDWVKDNIAPQYQELALQSVSSFIAFLDAKTIKSLEKSFESPNNSTGGLTANQRTAINTVLTNYQGYKFSYDNITNFINAVDKVSQAKDVNDLVKNCWETYKNSTTPSPFPNVTYATNSIAQAKKGLKDWEIGLIATGCTLALACICGGAIYCHRKHKNNRIHVPNYGNNSLNDSVEESPVAHQVDIEDQSDRNESSLNEEQSPVNLFSPQQEGDVPNPLMPLQQPQGVDAPNPLMPRPLGTRQPVNGDDNRGFVRKALDGINPFARFRRGNGPNFTGISDMRDEEGNSNDGIADNSRYKDKSGVMYSPLFNNLSPKSSASPRNEIRETTDLNPIREGFVRQEGGVAQESEGSWYIAQRGGGIINQNNEDDPLKVIEKDLRMKSASANSSPQTSRSGSREGDATGILTTSLMNPLNVDASQANYLRGIVDEFGLVPPSVMNDGMDDSGLYGSNSPHNEESQSSSQVRNSLQDPKLVGPQNPLDEFNKGLLEGQTIPESHHPSQSIPESHHPSQSGLKRRTPHQKRSSSAGSAGSVGSKNNSPTVDSRPNSRESVESYEGVAVDVSSGQKQPNSGFGNFPVQNIKSTIALHEAGDRKLRKTLINVKEKNPEGIIPVETQTPQKPGQKPAQEPYKRTLSSSREEHLAQHHESLETKAPNPLANDKIGKMPKPKKVSPKAVWADNPSPQSEAVLTKNENPPILQGTGQTPTKNKESKRAFDHHLVPGFLPTDGEIKPQGRSNSIGVESAESFGEELRIMEEARKQEQSGINTKGTVRSPVSQLETNAEQSRVPSSSPKPSAKGKKGRGYESPAGSQIGSPLGSPLGSPAGGGRGRK